MVVVLQPFLAEFVRFFTKNTRYEIRLATTAYLIFVSFMTLKSNAKVRGFIENSKI